MTETKINVIRAALIASPVILLVMLVLKLIRDLSKRDSLIRRTRVNGGLFFSAGLLLSMWSLRFAVGYYIAGLPEQDNLTWWETISDSLLHALQTFSMDEEYTKYITFGGTLLKELTGSDGWATAYSVYASILNALAPIVGGAFILDILASVFPSLHLWFNHLAFWREKLYFSELSEVSLALAKSMSADSKKLFCQPVIVFTDAYVDDQDEQRSELMLEAKLLGAICVKDDLSHVGKNVLGKRSFFLINEVESENLRTLVNLCDGRSSKYVKNARIFLFLEGDGYVQVEQQIKKKLEKKKCLPVIIPIHSYRNLACNLLVDLPLYEPLVNKPAEADGKKELRVSILGSGSIGMQMLLAVYWFGQILDCKLHITVVSEEPEEVFLSKLDYINPELASTTKRGDAVLQIYGTRYSDPYATIEYVQSDVRSGDFWGIGNEAADKAQQADYFIVALGSDEDNLTTAERLRIAVGRKHLEQNNGAVAAISYVIYDSRLCRTLNGSRCFCHVKSNKPDVYMQAFGSLDHLYSTANVFMSLHTMMADGVGEAYSSIYAQRESAEDNRARMGKMDRDYAAWANMARAMHIKYKVYSLGWVQTSVFDSADEDKSEHQNAVRDACVRYRWASLKGRIIQAEDEPEIVDTEQEQRDWQTLDRIKHDLAWLEHRRWNAFTRTRGYRWTDNCQTYFDIVGHTHKHMALKLHPCLVECDNLGCRLDDDRGLPLDRLDALSVQLADLSYEDQGKQRTFGLRDFKEYDYSKGEFSEYLSEDAAMAHYRLSRKKLRKRCEGKKLRGAFCRTVETEAGTVIQWFVPKP